MEGLLESLKYYLESGKFVAYLIVLLGGVLTSFTPCVYPVLPITVSYIGANASDSKIKGFILSALYVAGMALTYSVLGAFAALTGKFLGKILTSPVSYFLIGNICIFLGLSMLEVFSLPLPSFFTKIRPKTKGQGALPAFLIGLASGFVVAPCTAPVLGVILAYVATKKNLIFGMSLLFTFAVGMGTLIILLGTFTGLLVSMPKAGPWLNKIKKGFGWILVFSGEYFFIMSGRLFF